MALKHVRRPPPGDGSRPSWTDSLLKGFCFRACATEFCHLTLGDTIVGQAESVFVISGLRGRDRTVYLPREVSAAGRTICHRGPSGSASQACRPGRSFGNSSTGSERTRWSTGLYRRVVRVLTAAGLAARERPVATPHLRLPGLFAVGWQPAVRAAATRPRPSDGHEHLRAVCRGVLSIHRGTGVRVIVSGEGPVSAADFAV